MSDAAITITPGVGTNVDVSQITRPDGVTVVERQRFVLGDDGGDLLSLVNGKLPASDSDAQDTLNSILSELRQIKFVLSAWTGVTPIDFEGDY